MLVDEVEGLVVGGGLFLVVAAAAREALAATDARVRAGSTIGAGEGVRRLAGPGTTAERRSAADVIAGLRADLRAFRASIPGGAVVAVNLCSTDAPRTPRAALASLPALEAHLATAGPADVGAAVCYTYAALAEGFPLVNFTPLEGPDLPALDALARARRLPYAGKDGKTGETLLKSVLAPLFRDRNLQVLSWAGVNFLGNRDGEALRDPGANAAKVADKDRVLGQILGDQAPQAVTRIDYVRSLGDWKTAWDLVHFAGFCGVRMTLQFTWQGCDSALAAPLVLDLVRLLDLARRRGESGAARHTAVFWKSPAGDDVPAEFPAQMALLLDYAARARAEAAAATRVGPGSRV